MKTRAAVAFEAGKPQGTVDIDSLITHKLKLANIKEGFDLMHAGESIRSVVEF